MKKRAATATVRSRSEPQGGWRAVDSPVGRGRMGRIFGPRRPREKFALVPKHTRPADRDAPTVLGDETALRLTDRRLRITPHAHCSAERCRSPKRRPCAAPPRTRDATHRDERPTNPAGSTPRRWSGSTRIHGAGSLGALSMAPYRCALLHGRALSTALARAAGVKPARLRAPCARDGRAKMPASFP